jgi:hypothetical protein
VLGMDEHVAFLYLLLHFLLAKTICCFECPIFPNIEVVSTQLENRRAWADFMN